MTQMTQMKFEALSAFICVICGLNPSFYFVETQGWGERRGCPASPGMTRWAGGG
jgi:hypothetical protein